MSNTSGPSTSVFLTKTILDFGIMRSETLRASKLMMAAMRARSLSFKMSFGVRLRMSMKSVRDLGVYLGGVGGLGGLGGVLRARYFSNLGSSQRTNLCIKLSNMII